MIPKRERSGPVIRPGRVVAPTSVKRGSSRRIVRAAGPCPRTMSILKSSMAG
jgi:ribosomal protein L15E